MSDELENVLPDDDAADFASITNRTQTPSETPAEPPAATPEPTPQTPAENPMIPHARFQEVNQRAQAAERARDEAVELLKRYAPRPEQPAAQPQLDMFENPEGFIRQTLQDELRDLQEAKFLMLRDITERQHTPEVVKAASLAFDAAQDAGELHPSEYEAVARSKNPFAAAVEWHQRREVLKEVGPDPAAYRQRILDDARKDPAYVAALVAEARQNATRLPGSTPSNVRTLPSTARVGAAAVTDSVDEPDDEQDFKAITKRRR